MQQTQPNLYPAQPHLEPPINEGQADSFRQSESTESAAALNPGQDDFISKSSILPPKPSRSVARMAVAESAAANAFVDPIHRYQPKKPSPLALKAAEEKRKAAASRGENLRAIDTNTEETLSRPNDYYASNEEDHASRQISGEWGVALGSPNNDGSFAAQQYGTNPGPAQSRYSNDPYLSTGQGQNRAPSGQYTSDPYAAYHDGQQEQQGAAKRGNWV